MLAQAVQAAYFDAFALEEVSTSYLRDRRLRR